MVTGISFILRVAFIKISGRYCYIAMAPPSYLFFIFISAVLVNLVALVVNLLVNYSVQFNRSEMELQCRLTSQMLKSVYWIISWCVSPVVVWGRWSNWTACHRVWEKVSLNLTKIWNPLLEPNVEAFMQVNIHTHARKELLIRNELLSA